MAKPYTKPCKAILIDPFACTVTEVDWNGNIDHIYELISHESMPVECFDCVSLGNAGNDAIFVDDEGLFKDSERFFRYRDINQPMAGKGLILGADDEGESIAPYINVDKVKKAISFLLHIGGGNFVSTDKPWIRPEDRNRPGRNG